MRYLLSAILLVAGVTNIIAKEPNNSSPLSKYSPEWNDPKYQVCNTAANTKYLSAEEREVIYVLNMARMNPKLFCKTVLSQAHQISDFVDTSNEVYYKSLVKEMMQMEPLPILKPDSLCYVSAHCHAATTGPKGYVGHDRQSADCRKKQHFHGECCQYGLSSPLAVIVDLLVDQDVESLGHRRNCLGSYSKMSPSMGPHAKYGIMTVLDFY